MFDFDDVDYDLGRLGKKSLGKKSLKKRLEEVIGSSPCKTLGQKTPITISSDTVTGATSGFHFSDDEQ